MRKIRTYFPGFLQITDTIVKEMTAAEFIEFAETKRHLIKESRYVPAKFGSKRWGKFIVVISDGNYHITRPKF